MAYTIIVKKSERELSRQRAANAPAQMRGQLSAVVRSREDAANLAYFLGGRGIRPDRPVMVETKRGRVIVEGLGQATAAELEDLAVSALERPAGPDFDHLREKNGLMRREEVDAAVRNALLDKVAKHKANHRTDPGVKPKTEMTIKKATRRTRTT